MRYGLRIVLTDPLTTLVAAFLICATALACVLLLRRAPRAETDLLVILDRERAAMRLEFAKGLEDAVAVGETIKRHRARIDGGTRGAPAAGAPPQRSLFELSSAEVAKLPVDAQLAWAKHRTGARH